MSINIQTYLRFIMQVFAISLICVSNAQSSSQTVNKNAITQKTTRNQFGSAALFYGYDFIDPSNAQQLQTQTQVTSANNTRIISNVIADRLSFSKYIDHKNHDNHKNRDFWVSMLAYSSSSRKEEYPNITQTELAYSSYDTIMYGPVIGLDKKIVDNFTVGLSISKQKGYSKARDVKPTPRNNFSNVLYYELMDDASVASRNQNLNVYARYDFTDSISLSGIVSASEQSLKKNALFYYNYQVFDPYTLYKIMMNTESKNFFAKLEYKNDSLSNKIEIIPYIGLAGGKYKTKVDYSYFDTSNQESFKRDYVSPQHYSEVNGKIGSAILTNFEINKNSTLVPSLSIGAGKRLFDKSARSSGLDFKSWRITGNNDYNFDLGANLGLFSNGYEAQTEYKLFAKEGYLSHQLALTLGISF
ncbi:MAG: autotransporter domain-containing protein [Rickettsiaceae bacterium]|nr:autotransporter domain-containing protein [Rickettsiaceae bacterium]